MWCHGDPFKNTGFNMNYRFLSSFLAGVMCLVVSGCSSVPAAGPRTRNVMDAGSGKDASTIEVVDLTPALLQHLQSTRSQRTFSEGLGVAMPRRDVLGAGDTIAVTIWEAPPATLFGSGDAGATGTPATSRATAFPDQVIDANGQLNIPFAGTIPAAGLTISQLEREIVRRLKGKANQPQVLARLLRNVTADVTVVGEVSNSTRVPLTPKGERLLDAVAAAGGVRQPVGKILMQVTRGEHLVSMPLDSVIRDPRQNVPLQAGDVITALYQPSSFMALGATGKNEEIDFEGQGISLAQALARAGGVLDSRADAEGVFVFRLEDRHAVTGDRAAASPVTDEGKVPTVYRLDLKDPAGMFLAQQFPMRDKDTLYVSNAPVADIQKLANLFYTIVFPAMSVGTQLK
jgi:polysaccharide export outer membrane protein